MISQVAPEQLDLVWPHFLPLVKRGLRHGQGDSMAPCHILKGIQSGEMNLWIAHQGENLQAGLIYMVNQFPTKKVVFVVMLVGDRMEEWVEEMETMLIQYKESIGADCIEASCRKGLAKKLMERGWKQKAIIMEAPNGR